MMAFQFDKWISAKRNFNIDGFVCGQISTNGNQSKKINCGLDKENKFEVTVTESNLSHNIVKIDNVLLYLLSDEVESSVDQWRHDYQERKTVCHKLVQHLSELCCTKEHNKQSKLTENEKIVQLKNFHRLSALKRLTTDEMLADEPPAASKYSLVVNCSSTSILAISTQVIGHLLAGVPVTVVSDLQSSIGVAYLVDLFNNVTESRYPGVLNHLIDFNVNQHDQIAAFVVTETADIDSALESVLQVYTETGISCVKIFAQESLRNPLSELIQEKLKLQYPDELLFTENELFPVEYRLSDARLSFNDMDFESNKPGISVYFYRTHPESIKMLNHFQKCSKPKFVSIWCEDSSLGHRIGSSIKSSKQILINTYGQTVNRDYHWHFERIASCKLSFFVNDNNLTTEQPNKKWSTLSVKQRNKVLTDMLDTLSIPFSKTIRLGLPQSMSHVEEDLANSQVIISHFEPIGNVIMQLDQQQQISPCSLSFAFYTLATGNCVVIVGNGDQVKIWKKIAEYVNTREHGSNVVQIIERDQGLLVPTKSDGAVQVVDGEKVQSLYIDLSQFDGKHYARIVRRLRQWISINLPEIEMTKIVE